MYKTLSDGRFNCRNHNPSERAGSKSCIWERTPETTLRWNSTVNMSFNVLDCSVHLHRVHGRRSRGVEEDKTHLLQWGAQYSVPPPQFWRNAQKGQQILFHLFLNQILQKCPFPLHLSNKIAPVTGLKADKDEKETRRWSHSYGTPTREIDSSAKHLKPSNLALRTWFLWLS